MLWDTTLLLGLCLRLGSNALRGAVDDHAVLNKSLDQPVISSVAGYALVNTLLAQIKVAVIAGRAVVVRLGDSAVTAVAADSKVGSRCASRSLGSGSSGSPASRARTKRNGDLRCLLSLRLRLRWAQSLSSKGSLEQLDISLHLLVVLGQLLDSTSKSGLKLGRVVSGGGRDWC